METHESLQVQAVRQMADDYISRSQEFFHTTLSRGPAAVEWMAGQIPRVRLFDDTTKEGIAMAMGSLLGESLIATYGGQWQLGGREWEVQLISGTVVQPVEMVRTQMRGGPSIFAVFGRLGRGHWWQFWRN